MANIFTNSQVNDTVIHMSNGLTSVFIETFCLAGTKHVSELFEKDLLIWFAQRDWVLTGMGSEGFDISEINWDEGYFERQKQFVLDTINAVFERYNWELLAYEPNEDFLFERLEVFRNMITSFEVKHLKSVNQIRLFDFDTGKYDTCEKHLIYKHCAGCVICNNEP